MADAPASLRARVLQAVGAAGSNAALADQLAAAGAQLLEQAKSGPPDHDTALTLLAADALITYACEALAEAGLA